MLLRSRHNRAVFMILLRFYVRSYLGGALEVSILVYDQGTYPDGAEKSTTHLSFWRSTSRKSICHFLQDDILPMKWWIDLYRHRETSSALLWISAWAYQRSGRRNLHPTADDDLA